MADGILTEQATRQLFTEARTHNAWLDRPVSDEILKKAYDLAKFGPTSANCSPLRVVFVRSQEAKARLKPCLAEGNIEKTMAAPVTALLGMDMKFYDHLPKLFPQADARAWFTGNDAVIADTAFRNSSLQAAYFIIAARACGLDCGPMSGFDKAKADETFFKGTSFKSNFLCNIGYGDKTKLHPRNPRFAFEDVCQIL
ncbi:MAG: malonic semialdehyde reductase [Alphaproteobacteria bacterium]|nr:malonic semialdehyde reductase [Alphaproteobacteria bacterium]MDE2337535.1 malonic semialdehyde reductase [Alphaproteobacteria bacterium]